LLYVYLSRKKPSSKISILKLVSVHQEFFNDLGSTRKIGRLGKILDILEINFISDLLR
jgi:hypothetical protein